MERKFIITDCVLIWNDNTKINALSTEDSYSFFISYFEKLNSVDVLFLHYTEFVGEPFSRYNIGEQNSLDINLLQNVLEKNNNNLVVVFGGHDCLRYENMPNTKNINFLHWPTFLLHYTYYNSLEKYKSIPTVSNNFDKLFISLNKKPKQHRAMIVDELCKNNLFNHGIFTWNELTNEWSNSYKFKYWVEEIKKLDIENISDYRFDFLTDNILNHRCLFNIVGETLDNNDMFFITEKTYKNLLYKQPFVCVGSPYQNLVLKQFGFELYDEIIDYSFDYEQNIEKRVIMLIDNFVRLKNENVNSLYEKIKHKVNFNHDRYLELIREDRFIPETLKNLYFKHKTSFIGYKNSYMYTDQYLNQIFGYL